MITVLKASNLAHLRDNAAADDLVLDHEDIAALDAAFPPPRGRSALAML